jgi:hypothetical protein
MSFLATDFLIKKRGYAALFGTDFQIFLGGGLTDVCVPYTFVDAHPSDYF